MGLINCLYIIVGWLVFVIVLMVYFFFVECIGSFWDCGEFIFGVYKLQVVYLLGVFFFIFVGWLFIWFVEFFLDNFVDIVFVVNLMLGIFMVFVVVFVVWIIIILGKMVFVGWEGMLDSGQNIVFVGVGIVVGLIIVFVIFIWFFVVEGEVYVMFIFFIIFMLWVMMKWYNLLDMFLVDCWLLFIVYVVGFFIGVYLFSLLMFLVLVLFYYFKKYNEYIWKGIVIVVVVGVVIIVAV